MADLEEQTMALQYITAHFPVFVASRDVSPTLFLKVPPKIGDKRRNDHLKSLRQPWAAAEVGDRHLIAGRARCRGERL